MTSFDAPSEASPRLALSRASSLDDVRAAVAAWVVAAVPSAWRDAAEHGGHRAIRGVRSRADYERWYPRFADSGLVVATWPVAYGGLDLDVDQARVAEEVLAPYNLGRLNPLGLNNTAPALFAHGTEEQRRRFLPPIVRNEERWAQLFSEPGAGSDLASLATRAVADGDEWVLSGQKVWTTWAHEADFAVCLARTDPTVPKRRGITYFLVDLHAPGVDVRPLRHIGGEVDFNEVFLDEVRVPDAHRVGPPGEGWRVAGATLAGERQMVAGSGSGGVDRIGGASAQHLLDRLARSERWNDPLVRQHAVALWSEERIRAWTNQRVRAQVATGSTPGPEASIGKVHQGELNQRIQMLATDVLGPDAIAWLPAGEGAGTGEATPDRTDPDGRVGDGTGEGTDADADADTDTDADADTGRAVPRRRRPERERLPDRSTGPGAWAATLPYEVRGMLRSRANTIEGGTTEVNKNIVGERVLGLPREPDPWRDTAWEDTPRS